MEKCSQCSQCIHIIRELNNISPVGWKPFAWGFSEENPQHFYVFPEETPDLDIDPQELAVRKICEIQNPVKRK